MYQLKNAVLAYLLTASALVAGCGGTYYDYLQAAIDSKRHTCAIAELAIVERQGSTEAEDDRDMAKVRGACDLALRALDALTKGSD